MNILIVKLGSIGDIVHTLPSLAAIRNGLPESSLSWVVERRSAEILRNNELIDDLIEIDTRSLRKLRTVDDAVPEIASQLRHIRKTPFDIALDFQGLMKSGLIGKLSRAKRRWGFARAELREPSSRVFFTDLAAISPQTHVIRKNLALVRQALSIPIPSVENLEFPIATDEIHKREALEIAETAGRRFVILNPAGGWTTKLWPAENFALLADKIWTELGLRAVVVTGPNESDLANIIGRSSRSDSIIFSQPDLKTLYELARKSSLYVGGDTGPTHIAIAAGVPIVGLFGPTEWWRNGSLVPDDVCVERTDIECRVNCHRRKCSNWICMNSDVDTVFRASVSRLALVKIPVEGTVAPVGFEL